MPDLFEFASQVATPEYVAARIAETEAAMANAHDSIVLAAVVLAVALIVIVVCLKVYGKSGSDAWFTTVFIAVFVTFFAVVALLGNFMAVMSLAKELALWSCDPVTEVATKLAAAI